MIIRITDLKKWGKHDFGQIVVKTGMRLININSKETMIVLLRILSFIFKFLQDYIICIIYSCMLYIYIILPGESYTHITVGK